MPKRECEILNFTCFDWLPLELDVGLWSQVCEDKILEHGVSLGYLIALLMMAHPFSTMLH